MLDFYTKREKTWVWLSLITDLILSTFIFLSGEKIIAIAVFLYGIHIVIILINSDRKRRQ